MTRAELPTTGTEPTVGRCDAEHTLGDGRAVRATRLVPAGPRGLWDALCRATGAVSELAAAPAVDLRGTDPHLAYLASVQR